MIPTTIGIKKSDAQDLCSRQSKGLLCVLAALCSTWSAPASLYKDMFCKREEDDDDQLLQRLRTAFSYELTHLAARGFSTCKALALKHVKDILDDIIVTMFDFEAIKECPTCNLDLLLKLGGEYSKRKGAALLEKSQNTEEDGFGYKSHDLLSWCEDTGKLFLEWDSEDSHIEPDEKFRIASVGRAFQIACTNIQRGHVNVELATSSAEEECEKRCQLLRSLFASMRQNKNSFGDLSRKDITGCITNNIFYLSKTVAYYEEQLRWGCEDNDSRYKRAQIRAYEDAYIGFCGSVLSDMLNENVHWVRVENKKNSILQRVESVGVNTVESELILKLLSRVFVTRTNDLNGTPNGLSSKEEDVEAYSSVLCTLKTCLCDLLGTRTENNSMKYIFSCAKHIMVKLQVKTSGSLLNSQGTKSSHVTYIHEFTKWLKICGELIQEEDCLADLCALVTNLNSTNRDEGGSSDPTNPRFTPLVATFKTLNGLEKTLLLRTINPYAAKHRVVSNAVQRSGQNLKLSRSCLRAVKDFIDVV